MSTKKNKGKQYGISDLRSGLKTSVAHKEDDKRDHSLPDKVRDEARRTPSAASMAGKEKAAAAEAFRIKKRHIPGESKDVPIGKDMPTDEDEKTDEGEEAEEGELEEDLELTPPRAGQPGQPSGLNKTQKDIREAEELEREHCAENEGTEPDEVTGIVPKFNMTCLRVSAPPGPARTEGIITGEAAYDAVKLMLIDASDPKREGGQIEDFPCKIIGAETGRPAGPWYIFFSENREAVANFVKAYNSEIEVEAAGDTMITCKISIDNNTKDHKASMMAEETGVWMKI